VTLSLTVPAFVSNPNASISVNGDLSDWSSLTSFGLDPQDASGSGDVADWAREMFIAAVSSSCRGSA
jgi:hypothetical protein